MRLLLTFAFFALALCSQSIRQEIRYTPDADRPIQRLELVSPSNAAGLLSDVHFHARVRTSLDGEVWSAWEPVALGHEGGSLVYDDGAFRFIELIAAFPIRVLAIDPGQGSLAKTMQPRSSAAQPDIVNRAGWGCGQDCAPRENPVFANVTHLVVHHSAGANASSDWAAVVRSIWVLHVRGNGWNDIGYNYLIDPNGVIYEGRAGGDGVIGAHFSGVNSATMGVCMIGTYSTAEPRQQAIDSLKQLLSWQAGRWSLDPSGQTLHPASQLTLNVISGHRDAGLSPRASGTTECPGNSLYSYLPSLRKDVARQNQSCALRLTRRNLCFGGAAGSTLLPLDNSASCALTIEGQTEWLRVQDGRISADANSSSARRSADLRVNGLVLNVSQAPAGLEGTPCLARGGVVNAASFEDRPLALGAIGTVFGEGLDGAQVLINGRLTATVFAATDSQINFALPAGVNTGSARLEVSRGGVRGNEVMFWVSEAIPGIFAAQNFEDGGINGPALPVQAGKALVVYVTGSGTNRSLPWDVSVGGVPAQGLFLGPTPGFVGLSQANLLVPETLQAGEHPLVLRVSGAASLPFPVVVRR
jgi:uncharacterized protein (TIGR03437 family)